eukprot:scaffold76211_cov64-Phaeocystis_antarctica.AAC.3
MATSGQAARTVAEEHDEAAEVAAAVAVGADVLEELRELGHRGGRVEGRREVRLGRADGAAAELVLEIHGGHGGEGAQQQPAHGVGEEGARDGEGADGRVGRLLEGERDLGLQLLLLVVAVGELLELDPVVERRAVALGGEDLLGKVVGGLVADGDVEEAGDAVGLDVARPLRLRLDVTSEALLALVEARVELQVGPLARLGGGARLGAVEGVHGAQRHLLELLLELERHVEVLVDGGEARRVLQRLHLLAHPVERPGATPPLGDALHECVERRDLVPAEGLGLDLDRRAVEDALHRHVLAQPDRDDLARAVHAAGGPLVGVLLHALEHAAPAGQVEGHRARRLDPQLGVLLHVHQVVAQDLRSEVVEVLLREALQPLEDAHRGPAGVRAPRRVAEVLERGEEEEEALLAVGRLPLGEPAVEEGRAQLGHRLVGARARVERRERRDALTRRHELALLLDGVERVEPVHILQRLPRVVVHKVLHDGLVRQQVRRLMHNLEEGRLGGGAPHGLGHRRCLHDRDGLCVASQLAHRHDRRRHALGIRHILGTGNVRQAPRLIFIVETQNRHICGASRSRHQVRATDTRRCWAEAHHTRHEPDHCTMPEREVRAAISGSDNLRAVGFGLQHKILHLETYGVIQIGSGSIQRRDHCSAARKAGNGTPLRPGSAHPGAGRPRIIAAGTRQCSHDTLVPGQAAATHSLTGIAAVPYTSVAVAARQVTIRTAAHHWRPRRKVDPEVVHLARRFGRDHGGALARTLGRCCGGGGGWLEIAQPC